MKSHEIFLIFSEKTIDNDRFLERARELKIKMTPLFEGDLAVILRENKMRILFKKRDITAKILRGRIIFRGKGPGKNTVIALAKFAEQNQIPFLDSVGSISLSGKTCYLTTVKLKNTKHIPTVFCEKVSDLTIKPFFKPPFFVKPAFGNRNRGVKIIRKVEDLRKSKWRPILIQPLLNFTNEYRVLVLGDRILAVASRSEHHISGRGELPQKIQNEALRICADLEIELGGVDFARIGQTFYFLEANRACGICGVERETGIDASGEIIRFALRKKAN